MANQIIDLDRGKLATWAGTYDDYLRRKEAALAQEARQQADLTANLPQEEVWIRKGIQARRTRNEGRVRSLIKMREQRAERRQKKDKARMQLDRAENSGKLVIEATNVCFDYDEKWIVKDFSTRILRGDRIGLLGANGVGKTTLLRLLLGELSPTSGNVRLGSSLEIAVFDQLRSQVNLNATIVDAIGEGREQIEINGRPKHVISYLSDFLFTPARPDPCAQLIRWRASQGAIGEAIQQTHQPAGDGRTHE